MRYDIPRKLARKLSLEEYRALLDQKRDALREFAHESTAPNFMRTKNNFTCPSNHDFATKYEANYPKWCSDCGAYKHDRFTAWRYPHIYTFLQFRKGKI